MLADILIVTVENYILRSSLRKDVPEIAITTIIFNLLIIELELNQAHLDDITLCW